MYIELFIVENENKNEVGNFSEEGTGDFFEKLNDKKKDLNIIIPKNDYLYENNNNLSSINSPNPLKNQNNTQSERLNINILDEMNNNNNVMSHSGMNNTSDKNVIKRYKTNSTLPMIIISVSANMNSYQF